MNALEKYKSKVPKPIQVVTDDVDIMKEISEIKENGYFFLDPEPAPRRIPDKVKRNFFHAFHTSILTSFSILEAWEGWDLQE